MAPRDVAVGAQWDQALLDAIDQSAGLILILSGASNDSPFVQSEVNRAFRQRKPIFTFRIENVTPSGSLDFYLGRHHWMDAFNGPLPGHVAALAKAITAAPAPPVPSAAAAAVATPFWRRPLTIAAALVLALSVAGIGIYRWRQAPAATEATAGPRADLRLAVVPLKVIGDDPTLPPVALGISEALSAKLAQIDATVSASTAVQQLPDDATVADIGRRLGVNTVVSGTIQRNAGSIRVILTVDDASSGQREWTREFTGMLADLLTLEDEAFNQLTAALRLRPTPDQAARATMHATANVDAYQLYLEGRSAMRRQADVKNVERALTLFKQAVAADPAFALAYSGIADANTRLFRATRRPEYAEDALAAAEQAQQLDDTALDIKLSLISVYQITGRNAEALAALTSAAQAAPRSDEVLRRLGRLYLTTSRGDEALATYQRAIDVNPYYWVGYAALAAAHMQLGDYERALPPLLRVIELDPGNAAGYNDLGAAYLQLGRYAEATAAFEKANTLRPAAITYTNLGITQAYAGSFRNAVPYFEKAVEMQPENEQFVGNLGDGYRWAGEQVKARDAYARAIQLAVAALKVNPRDSVTRSNLALYYAKQGDHATARRMIREALATNPENVSVQYALAITEALAGRKAEALTALKVTFDNGFPRTAATAEPDLRSLAQDPAFVTLTTRH